MTANTQAEVERLARCPNCGRGDIRQWCRAWDRLLELSDQRFVYSKCGACGVLFQSLRPTEQVIHRYYPDSYHPYATDADQTPRHRGRWAGAVVKRLLPERSVKAKFKKIYRELKPGTAFLDFGCGSGEKLNSLRKQGCVTIGMDFSEHALSVVQRNGHKTFLIAPGVWDDIADESLDFVRLNHVLEHLYAPRDVLAQIVRKMKPGAVLHIAVPNPGGWSAALFRSAWLGLDCPRHIILYPPEALCDVLKEFRFVAPQVFQEPVVKDIIRSWGYVLNHLGWIGRDRVARMGASPLLNLLFAPGGWAAFLFRRADRYHVLAIK